MGGAARTRQSPVSRSDHIDGALSAGFFHEAVHLVCGAVFLCNRAQTAPSCFTLSNPSSDGFPHIVLPKHSVFKQFVAFGEAVCDRFAVWQRKIRYEDLVIEDPDDIYSQVKRNERGQIFACSHLGNTEVCRALVSHHKDFRLNVLVHSKHAQAFNEALQKAGADHIRLIQVTDLDTTLMMELNSRIEDGEWIAIAADRVPVRGEKTADINFLGHTAPMPQGAWLLASLLKTQVNTLFCVKQNGRYHLKLRRFTDTSSWKRGNREAAVKDADAGFCRHSGARMCAKSATMVQFFMIFGAKTPSETITLTLLNHEKTHLLPTQL